jgi:hypothetical protein
MKAIAAIICLVTLAQANADDPQPAKERRKPNFTISKETTYVTGPLGKDGYIDYAAALNERNGKGVTPETNANVLIWKALGPKPAGDKRMPAEFFKLMGIDEPPEKGEYFVDLRTFLREQLNIEDAKSVDAIDRQATSGFPWAERDHPEIAKWLKANETPLNLVVEASNRPHYFAPIVPDKADADSGSLVGGILNGGMGSFRGLSRALASRAMQRVNDGEFDEAWRDLIACHRQARFAGKRGTMIDGFVALAMEQISLAAELGFLDRCPKDVKKLQKCVAELRSLPPRIMVSEQIGGTERLFQLSFATRSAASLPEDWDPALRNINQWYDRISKALGDPDRAKRQKQLSEIEDGLKKAVKDVDKQKDVPPSKAMSNVWIKLSITAVRKAQEASDRTEQAERNVHIAFAIAAYRIHTGTYPKSLDALVPKYLDKLPDDLFTGKPLVYRPSESGYLLYSLGPDGKDDDGRGPKDEPKGDDIAIRMPLPKPIKK